MQLLKDYNGNDVKHMVHKIAAFRVHIERRRILQHTPNEHTLTYTIIHLFK